MRVLCFGSLNIDYVYQVPHFASGGETLAAASLRRFSGGKGLNQSIALARAGLKVRHAGAVGTDGLFLLEELRAAEVDIGYVEVLEDVSTGHAVIQRTPAGENCILLYGGANRWITRERIDRALADFGPGDALVLQNEISELPYLTERAKARGMLIALNPSPMERDLLPLLPRADYLLVNEVETAQLLEYLERPVPETAEGLAEALAGRFPAAAVVLTLGPQGSLCAAGGRLVRQAAHPARVVDTTAAGDAYTGFFLAGVLSGESVERAMEYASAAAAIAVSRPGAAPSIPSREEVLAKING